MEKLSFRILVGTIFMLDLRSLKLILWTSLHQIMLMRVRNYVQEVK